MAVASDSRAGLQQRLRRGWLRRVLMYSVPALLLAGAGYWYLLGGRYAETDDAYVQADTVSISADVAGRVVAVEVADNQPVNVGQVLFRLDDNNYRIALDHAQAMLASARLQIDGLRASYRQKLAEQKQAQDTQAYQQREYDRQQQLFAEHVTSQANLDAARHALDTARQQVASTEQQIANTLAALGGNPDIATADHPLVRQAQAQVDQAKLDLSHTVVAAPLAGTVTNVDKLPIGEYLNAATPAFALVANKAWIEADFKETDLTHMRPGQKATVDVDTYPDHTFTATVQSIGAGTGSQFSVLPSQNASGNWVKVVQRIPVRLTIEDPDPDRPLRAGMSVDVSVDTLYRSPLLVKIESVFGRSDARR
ncbi:MAG TPA: HlyD family secretion protein [Stellaceae bacterium]|nr:HlyD family secretion protein [Stellaceae bacterium]